MAQILHHDPGARLGDDPEDVHKLRVAARRLRSDLHSFAAVLDPARTETIRSELGWLGGVVGVVRDTDVLSARLATRLAALPEPDAAGVHRLQVLLERQAVDTRTAMLIALRSARYLHLLDTLVDLAAAPPFRKAAGKLTPRTSQRLASKIVQKPWRRVAYAVESLGPDPSDTQLHQVRILAKRSRYAAEAAAPLLRPAATRFAPGHRPGRGVVAQRGRRPPRGSPDGPAADRAGTGATPRPPRPVARHMAQGQRQEAPHLGLNAPGARGPARLIPAAAGASNRPR